MSHSNQEILVLNALKYFQAEYQEGVPVNILKLELNLSDEELKETLAVLDGEGTVLIHDELVKLVETDLVEEDQGKTMVEEAPEKILEVFEVAKVVEEGQEEVERAEKIEKSVEEVKGVQEVEGELNKENTKLDINKEDINTKNLTEKELKAYDIIKKQADASGKISRTLLEGHLLYGDLKLSALDCYKMVASLENRGVIRRMNRVNGEYYLI